MRHGNCETSSQSRSPHHVVSYPDSSVVPALLDVRRGKRGQGPNTQLNLTQSNGDIIAE